MSFPPFLRFDLKGRLTEGGVLRGSSDGIRGRPGLGTYTWLMLTLPFGEKVNFMAREYVSGFYRFHSSLADD